MSENITSLTIDDVQYEIASLPKHIQDAASLHTEWNEKRNTLIRDVAQLDFAIQGVSNWIIDAVRAEATVTEQGE